MREIKFRAWNSIDKVFCDNSTTLTNLRGFIKSKHYHPMQYTGLKDKNGVEVYEGDICVNENGRIGKCVYHEPSASFDFIAVNSIGDNYGYEPQVWKFKLAVIGNIYENPELLEGENE